jgi:hypothetical protein
MKKLFLISAFLLISFATVFAQEYFKTNLRVRIIDNIEITEKLECEFTISHKCDFILWNNIDHNIVSPIPLLSFEKTYDFYIWRLDTYKTTHDDIVKIHYDDDKPYAITTIDSIGVETLYVNANDTKDYPKASK